MSLDGSALVQGYQWHSFRFNIYHHLFFHMETVNKRNEADEE
jgi:hypothetical protein